jgi:ribosomal protein L18E
VRKSRSSQTRNTTSEEVLNRPIDTQGNDPSPVVNALMSDDFLKGSNFDASQIALLLQQLVRQNQSLLANIETQGVEIARLREKQAQVDQEVAERLESSKRETQEILDKATKLKQTGNKKDKTIAKGVQMYQRAVNLAKANRVTDNLLFERQLREMPKETIVSPGTLMTVMENGSQVAKIFPEEVRIKHKVWYLQPGVQTEVPKAVADMLRTRRQSQAETSKRQQLLTQHKEASKLAHEWNSIEGSKTLDMPS